MPMMRCRVRCLDTRISSIFQRLAASLTMFDYVIEHQGVRAATEKKSASAPVRALSDGVSWKIYADLDSAIPPIPQIRTLPSMFGASTNPDFRVRLDL